MTTRPRTKLPAEILTIKEIAECFPDKWILLRVTDYDEHGRINAGEVMAVGKHSRVAWNKADKISAQHPEDHRLYYVFNASAHLDPGASWEEILKNVDLSKLLRGLL